MSTRNDALPTDNGQTANHDLGMALYLDEWMTVFKVKNAELAREIGCDRSLVGHWRNKTRPLTNITWIAKICEHLGVTQEQLSKMPPKNYGSLMTPKGPMSHSEPAAEGAAPTEGLEMIEERVGLIESIDGLPDELIPTARKLIERLKSLGGNRPSHPTKRGSTKA